MVKLNINRNLCKGCALCTTVCPKKILQIDKDQFNEKGYSPVVCVDKEECISCGMCTMICPDCVIALEEEEPEEKDQ